MVGGAYYFDTSALLKRYVKEKGSDLVDSFFRKKCPLLTASLAYAEVYSTFYRLYRSGHLSAPKLEGALASFEEDWRGFGVIDFHVEVRGKIPKLLSLHPLRGPDAVHLASALSLKERGVDFQVVASDKKLLNAVEGLDLSVINPEVL